MSFLCCCCLRPAANAEAVAGTDGDIEVARAADNDYQLDDLPADSSAHEIRDDDASIGSRSTHRRQMSQRQRNAVGASGCRVRWGNRCGLADNVSQEDCESLDFDGEDPEEDDGDDSYCEEFVNLAKGSAAGKPTTLYVAYSDAEPGNNNPRGSKTVDLRSLALRTERAGFQARRGAFTASALGRMNEERQRQGCQPLKFKQEFELVAEQLWKDLVQVRDGFAVVPRCVYFPRGFRRGERFGCLTYCTPRSARAEDCVPDAMVHFWRRAGVPRKPVAGAGDQSSAIGFRTNSRSDFPVASAGETYVGDKTSEIGRAFDKYRKYFPSQLLAGGCRFLGMHADMVQVAKDGTCNLICVALVFDFVASRKGREMRSPIV